MSNEEFIITIATTSGASESLSVARITLLSEVLEYGIALLGLSGIHWKLYKDGVTLQTQYSIEQAGIRHGDVLLLQQQQQEDRHEPISIPTAMSGRMDFSNLFNAAATTADTAITTTTTTANPPAPVHYENMNLEEAMQYNPHPQTFIQLLFSKQSLWKEFNYYQPVLAAKLNKQPIAEATRIWREECVKGGIRAAMRVTQQRHKDEAMKRKRDLHPDDAEANTYFLKQESNALIQQQYFQMQQEFPESLGRVLMLYVAAKVNGHIIQAFVDSGAQSTIMSEVMAKECKIDHLIDTRFEGTAVGVGTGKILGRVHLVALQIEESYFPCTITVMENANMGFLLGLDMLKRHNGCIDLETAELRFKLGEGEYMRTKFLHEKDLTVDKGGTKGFNVDQANKEVEDARQEKSQGSQDEDAMDD